MFTPCKNQFFTRIDMIISWQCTNKIYELPALLININLYGLLYGKFYDKVK